MKRWVGRERWWRVASFVLVALIASLSLPLGVFDAVVPSGSSSTVVGVAKRPAKQPQLRRIHTEVRATAVRRPLSEREGFLPASAWMVLALALLGLVLVSGADRPLGSPGLLPVQRGPPSSS